jgi:basic membrane protein A and related proteins
VTDVAGLRSSANVEGMRGAEMGAGHTACASVNLIESTRSSEYRHNLQMGADRRDDVIVAGSFLLTDTVVDAARANPAIRFVLVDPLVAPAGSSNLAVITFREDQAGFLAGALAGLSTRSGTVAGVYGLEDEADRRYRAGFEHGARYVKANIKTLGAYQAAADGPPYANPAWGQAQARAFMSQGADVIFGAGGTTGQGALLAAAQAGRHCIGTGDAATYAPAAACLLATATTRRDRAVEQVVAEAAAGHWIGGRREFGVADGTIGLSPLSLDQGAARERLQTIAGLLAGGQLGTGV